MDKNENLEHISLKKLKEKSKRMGLTRPDGDMRKRDSWIESIEEARLLFRAVTIKTPHDFN
jgi:hypothetical protein